MNDSNKQLIDDRLVYSGIFIDDGFLYYVRKSSINRMDIKTLHVEEILYAKGFTKNALNEDLGFINEEFVELFIDDGLIAIKFYATTLEHGHFGIGIAYAEIGEWKFHPRLDMSYNVPYFNIEDIETNFEMRSDCVMKLRFWYRIDEGDETKLCGITVMASDGMLGEDVVSGDYVYDTDWPSDTNRVVGYNYKENRVIYDEIIDFALVNIHTINQYTLISYYYCNEEADNNGISGNTTFVDNKNETVYENEAINSIISGDISYEKLLYADYYKVDDSIYILENEIINIKILTEEEKNTHLENDSFIMEYGYFDVASKVNIYKAEVIDGKLHFTLIYKEFE